MPDVPAILPPAAVYGEQLGEFLLSWDDVRAASSPKAMVLERA